MRVPCTQVVFNIISFPLPVFFGGPVASTYMECGYWVFWVIEQWCLVGALLTRVLLSLYLVIFQLNTQKQHTLKVYIF